MSGSVVVRPGMPPSDNTLVAGVDIGGTKTLAVLVRRTGEIVRQVRAPSGFGTAPGDVANAMSRLVVHGLGASPQQLAGIGAGAPAIVDPESGTVLSSPNLRELEGLGPRQLFGSLAEAVPVWVDNDVNLAALGEQWLGVARGIRHFIFVAVGTGIGTGLILDGRIYHGTGGAGEGGHIVLLPDGPPCGCGSRGCLESLASGWAIARRYQELTGQATSVPEIFSRLAAKEAAAQRVIEEAANFLGMGLATFINLLAPQMVVLGGGIMANQHAVMLPIVEASLRRHGRKPLLARTRLELSYLRETASAIGAAALAWQQVDTTNREGCRSVG